MIKTQSPTDTKPPKKSNEYKKIKRNCTIETIDAMPGTFKTQKNGNWIQCKM